MQFNKSYQQPNSDKDFKTTYLKKVWRFFWLVSLLHFSFFFILQTNDVTFQVWITFAFFFIQGFFLRMESV
jgi:hypothetical protein